MSLQSIRPLPIFLGIQQADDGDVSIISGSFTPPLAGNNTADLVKSRIHDNCIYFVSNYCLIAVIVALVVALMHPRVIISAALVYLLWMLHGLLIKKNIKVGQVSLQSVMTVQQRFYLFFSLSFVIVVWECLVPALIFGLITSIICLTHAALRDTTHLHEASERGNRQRDLESEGLLAQKS